MKPAKIRAHYFINVSLSKSITGLEWSNSAPLSVSSVAQLLLLQVLYHMFNEFSDIGAENIIATDVVLGIVSFFVCVLGSLCIGTLMGLCGSFSARLTHHLRVMEPMVVVVIPYLAFLVAEMFELSGILSYVQLQSSDRVGLMHSE